MSASMVHTRTVCRICGSDRLKQVLDLGAVPLAGGHVSPDLVPEAMRTLGAQVAAAPLLPLRLFLCERCTLCQVLDVVDPALIFGQYLYASSTVPGLVKHFEAWAAQIATRVPHGGLVVELGSNDGVLLAPLQAHGVRAVGVDPSDEMGRRARSRGLTAITAPFTPDIAVHVRDQHGPAALVTASNMFAHVDDVHSIMKGVDVLLADDGVFVVEVHHVAALLVDLQYDSIYHEHLCEYSLHALRFLFDLHGLEVVDVEQLPMHGGALRVFGQRRPNTSGVASTAARARVEAVLAAEQNARVGELATWEQFSARSHAHAAALRQALMAWRSAGLRVHGYGAAGRATILLNVAQIDAGLMPCIYDASPLRSGRLVPGVWIPVVEAAHLKRAPVAERPDIVLILAWNYAADIVAQHSALRDEGVRFFVPLPTLRELDR